MRIIPKKIKVKNTVWKCYSMPDIIVALIMFSIIFIAITKGVWAIAVIGGLLSIVMFMPTQDGIFYACILDTMLNDILNGKRPMSTEFALLMEAAIGISADLLVNMQTRYNLQMARKDQKNIDRFEKLRNICASLL